MGWRICYLGSLTDFAGIFADFKMWAMLKLWWAGVMGVYKISSNPVI